MREINMKKVTKFLPLATLAITALSVVVVTGSASAEDAIINSQVSSGISLSTSSGTVNVNVLPTGTGVQTIAGHTATVSTNSAGGYDLTLVDANNNNSLVSGGNNITASTGTQASPAALTAGTWGYRVDGVGGFGAGPTTAVTNGAISATTLFAGVPVSTGTASVIGTSSTPVSADETDVWYSVAADVSTPVGTYTDTVTYTATAK